MARTTEPSSSLPSPSTTQKTRKLSTVSTLLALFREEGPTALFAGVLPALVLVINPILQYTIFEQLKDALEKRRGRVLPRDIFVLGAIGKLMATVLTYPYITIKSRMHVAKKDGPRDNIIGSLKRVVREEGWGGLYKGIFLQFPQAIVTMQSPASDSLICTRNWRQSISKRSHRRLPLCLQRCSLRRQRAGKAKNSEYAPIEVGYDSGEWVEVSGAGILAWWEFVA